MTPDRNCRPGNSAESEKTLPGRKRKKIFPCGGWNPICFFLDQREKKIFISGRKR
jgi:hypothetical protein